MGVMHTILGFSFATTLMIANATSVAWLLCYYLLLKPAVSTSPHSFPSQASQCPPCKGKGMQSHIISPGE